MQVHNHWHRSGVGPSKPLTIGPRPMSADSWWIGPVNARVYCYSGRVLDEGSRSTPAVPGMAYEIIDPIDPHLPVVCRLNAGSRSVETVCVHTALATDYCSRRIGPKAPHG